MFITSWNLRLIALNLEHMHVWVQLCLNDPTNEPLKKKKKKNIVGRDLHVFKNVNLQMVLNCSWQIYTNFWPSLT